MPVSYADLETSQTIHRDVMDMLWDVYHREVPFTERIQEHGADSNYTEWPEDPIAAPAMGAQRVDGSDSTGNDATTGSVVGNRIQANTRKVIISDGTQAVNSVGNIGTLAHQIANRQIELRRDVEANMLTEDGSVADDGNTVAGRSAGYFAWIKTNYDIPSVGGAAVGGFSNGIVSSYTPGTRRALSMSMINDVVNKIYEEGETADCLMTVPRLKQRISEFLFSDSARVSTLYADTGQRPQDVTAVGSVGIYHTDHGTLDLISNPIQQPENATPGSERAHVAIFSSAFWALAYLDGPVTRPLDRRGLADRREVIAYWTLKALNERSSGMVTDIDYTAAVVA